MELSSWLKARRDAAGLTQRGLVEKIKGDRRTTVSPSRVCEFEGGSKIPSWRQLVDIMDALDLTEAEVAVGESLWKSAQLDHAPSRSEQSLENAPTELMGPPPVLEDAPTEAA